MAKKCINFTEYDVLGFDMDFTLARYKLVPFFNMVYDSICQYLVEEKRYSAEIFHNLHEDKDLIYKGLIVDFDKGNVLKLGHDGVILRATHGSKKLSSSDIDQVYGKERKFPEFEAFISGVRSPFNKWRFFENFFDMPALVAFARIVDSLGKLEPAKERSTYIHTWDDVYAALCDLYSPEQFKANKGKFFPNMKREPSKYIDKVSNDIKNWLMSLRQNNRKIFLLTSSFPDFASFVMEYSFGADWKSYFDLIIYGGRKPRFFTENSPFLQVVNTEIGEDSEQLAENGEYCHGNYTDLMKFLREITHKDDPKVIYFGDNLWADAWPSKFYGQWDTVLVLEEMDAEGYAVSDGTVPGHDDSPSSSGKLVFEHSSLVTMEEMELMVSTFWGSIFIDDISDSRAPQEKLMNTTYGDLISQYADVCVPSIEYLAGVPVDNTFSTFNNQAGNIKGFHPGCPKSLLS
ncbi:5'-nucleotidase domain-containing protein 1-like isoform X1 [Biomphalaria glabrata]|uniref:5'-nucleotidase domain-containing protein 1 n=2 Tax=Biomphalaria glabrata TaxID=6526 RepID=A0A9W3ALI3_BIOGL|nr:5'-nucleotidase domain-containing protein 1-like isoform X1 [Biomphalaria glabrata]